MSPWKDITIKTAASICGLFAKALGKGCLKTGTGHRIWPIPVSVFVPVCYRASAGAATRQSPEELRFLGLHLAVAGGNHQYNT